MYDCDALLAAPERYASQRFRRARAFVLDRADAIELVSFVESIGGILFAKRIFHWTGHAQVLAYEELRSHFVREAQPYIRVNHAQMGVDQGLAVLQAMRDGGWRRGQLPWPVKTALKTLRKRGNSIADIAKATGLTREQVKTGCDVRTRQKTRRSAAFSSLAMGTNSI